MNYKKRRKHSRKRCGICAGQRRRFGERDRMKKKLQLMDKELSTLQHFDNLKT